MLAEEKQNKQKHLSVSASNLQSHLLRALEEGLKVFLRQLLLLRGIILVIVRKMLEEDLDKAGICICILSLVIVRKMLEEHLDKVASFKFQLFPTLSSSHLQLNA